MICSLLAPLALAACIEPPEPVAVSARIGAWTRIAGLRIRPDKVVEDSRCPMNARCVWAGRATVRLTLRDGSRTRQVNVTLGEPIKVRDGRLALMSVSPEKMAGAQPKRPAPYRFVFEFQR
ncbi:hypothetical protein M9978_22465 [Sphingomonas sp. MG17]|jgi:hypothetical protein|uniref:Uncharacterized protein n=1 Tax=Sphingomonas tagetis TaxID=2949092 RepID=A0A9X2HN18_9SPHN|nr:hypothetical protein [Sphingomonas tagetis]MCP3733172.1 hypothetical protein [Sphingomonas tagetis]